MDPAEGHASQGPPKTPRWVWLLVGGAVAAVLLFVVLHLAGGSVPRH